MQQLHFPFILSFLSKRTEIKKSISLETNKGQIALIRNLPFIIHIYNLYFTQVWLRPIRPYLSIEPLSTKQFFLLLYLIEAWYVLPLFGS